VGYQLQFPGGDSAAPRLNTPGEAYRIADPPSRSEACLAPTRTLPRLDPCVGDPTFVNDTIRREHSPPAAS
jgi:hypothetical protein